MQHFRKYMFSSVSMIVLGIALLARPGMVIHTGARILGICLMLIGIGAIFFQGRFNRYASYLSFVEGAAAFLAGAVIFARWRFILNILPTATGLLIIVNGLIDLSRCYGQGRAGERHWLFSAFLSLISIFFGLFIFVHPFATVNAVARYVGAIFIYHGILDLFIQRRY
ncbi:MAG: DUF308 domain-containing protein [Clostridia bacterium]|nr:DUF308 domain-containing protein [Clostridia bacterium]